MKPELSLKDLQLIQLVNEENSLTIAARRMNVSQPAASQRLAQIEQKLGMQLFIRREGLMRSTDASKRLGEATLSIYEELEKTFRDLHKIKAGSSNQLRIATQCYTTYRWLPFVIRDMHALYPDLEIDVLPEATESPYMALEADRIDIALVFNPQPGFEFKQYPLFEDELYAVLHKDHPLATRQYLNPGNFAGETLVLYTGEKHAIVEEILKPAAVSPGRIMQVRMTEAIVELVRSRHGIAILSAWAYDDIEHKQDLVSVRITRSGFRRQWLAVAGLETNRQQVESFTACLVKLGNLIQRQRWRKAIQKGGSLCP